MCNYKATTDLSGSRCHGKLWPNSHRYGKPGSKLNHFQILAYSKRNNEERYSWCTGQSRVPQCGTHEW